MYIRPEAPPEWVADCEPTKQTVVLTAKTFGLIMTALGSVARSTATSIVLVTDIKATIEAINQELG